MAAALPAGVTRTRLPLITKDFVTIKDPQLLTTIDQSPDILRPGETQIPWLLRAFFSSTKVYYAKKHQWFFAFVGADKENRPARLKFVEDCIAKGFTSERIDALTAAVKGDGDIAQVSAEVAKAMGDLVLPLPKGDTIPQEVAEAVYHSGKDLSIAYNPFKLVAATAQINKVQAYLRSLSIKEEEIVDFQHHLGAGAHGMGKALMAMRGELTSTDMRTYFCRNPVMFDGALRVPARSTTVNGIFPDDAPLLPSSIVLLDNMTCAKDTMDHNLLFGMGSEERRCPFRNLFFEATTEIQKRMSNM